MLAVGTYPLRYRETDLPGSALEDLGAGRRARPIDHWFAFTDGDRHFHVLVAFGERTSPAMREQAWSILDTLRVLPGRLPDWHSAG